jgi:hypothetical protein
VYKEVVVIGLAVVDLTVVNGFAVSSTCLGTEMVSSIVTE